MHPVVALVARYRKAQKLPQKIILAEEILDLVEPSIREFLLSNFPPGRTERILPRALRCIVYCLRAFKGKTDASFVTFCRRVLRENLTASGAVRDAKRSTEIPATVWQAIVRSASKDMVADLVREYQMTEDIDYRVELADEILRSVGPVVQRFIRFYGHGRLSSVKEQEVYADTLVAIGDVLLRFDRKTSEQFRNYCFGIARKKVFAAFREIKQLASIPLDDSKELEEALHTSAQSSLMTDEEHTMLDDCMERLRRLKPPCYDYLYYRFIIGLDYDELAAVQDSTPAAVGMKTRRCLQFARTLIRPRN